MLAVISFFALAVFGLGALSFTTDADIISVPGLGQIPGAVGMLVAVLAMTALLRTALRRPRPTFRSAPVVAIGAALGHLIAVWVGVALVRGDLIVATAVAGHLVSGGASLVILMAAAAAAWGGIALRRTRAQHPQWPWERDEDE